MKLISELPHHPTEIYVIGSGKSMDFINPSFFNDKISIGINLTYLKFPVTYCIAHHHEIVQRMINIGNNVVASEYDMCIIGRKRPILHGNYFMYKHKNQGYLDIDYSDFDNPNALLCSGTTISAIHLAYKMGAKTIILCGIDGCAIDDEYQYKDYPIKDSQFIATKHLGGMQPLINTLCNFIRNRGVSVYSINPFNNLTMEYHDVTF